MNSLLLKASAVLWVIWGLVHVLAGVIVLSSDATGSAQAIADAVAPQALEADYHAAVGAILNQHGWNLGWIGLTTFIAAFYIWGGSANAIFLAALVGGLADVGYFIFLDLGGFVNFMPGTLMTIVSSLAIILSFYAYFTRK
ncbi:MAG: hypothetical protein AAF197_09780 [Pseudomonadota bacterium]